MIGKDILRFHTVYWPAFLLAAGLETPKRVFAHGWWTVEGQKMSKSLGNVIAPDHLVATYGIDASRYFLLREVPFGSDGDFSHKAIVHRTNGDLANDLGNLAQRSLSMIAKNCGNAVPEHGAFTDADKALLGAAHGLLDRVRAEFDAQLFHKGLEAIWSVCGDANRYIDEQAPWTLKKTDTARMATVLYVLAETIRHIAILVQPVVPESAAKMLDQLALGPDQRGFETLGPGWRAEARHGAARAAGRVPALCGAGGGPDMTMPVLVDSHCHLDFPDFGPEVEEVVARAHGAGVGLMVTISTKVSEFDKVRAVAERFPHVFCSVGIHPHEAASEPETDTATLVEMAKHPKVVGIGETGLDYYYEHSPREAQQRNFRAHIAAARETGLPLIVHTRDADEDTAEILAEETGKGAFPGLLHCFSSGPQLAERLSNSDSTSHCPAS